MKKFLKRLFVFLAIVIGILLIGSIVIAAFFKKQVGEQVLQAVNSSLITELQVESIDLDLLSRFPNASVVMESVNVPDALDGTSLLEAEELAFTFSMASLFGSTIKIKSVSISEGALFVAVDRRGRANYDIAKPSEDSEATTGGEISIALEDARMNNIELIYSNEKDKQDLRWNILVATIEGQFTNTRFDLSSYAEIKSVFVETEDGRYLVGKDLAYDAIVDVDMGEGLYDFENVELFVENNKFKVGGTLEEKGEALEMDLSIKGVDCSLASIIDLMPEEQRESLSSFNSKGDFKFDTQIKGTYDDYNNPLIKMEFGLTNGSIESELLAEDLKEVEFTATFDNGKKGQWKNATFNIEDFEGYFGRERMQSTLKVVDLDRPRVQFSIDGTIPMEAIYSMIENPIITDGSGELEIHNFKVDGFFEDLLSPNRISRVKTTGKIVFDDASLKVNGENMAFDKGELVFDDNLLAVNNLELEGADNEILFDGKFKNLFPVLLADSLNSKDAKLVFDAKLTAKSLDLDKLLALAPPLPEEDEVEEAVFDSLKVEQTQNRERLTNFLKGTFESKIDEFKYSRIEAKNFKGELAFTDGKMSIDGNVDAMDGKMDLDALVYFEDRPKLKAKLICENIDGEQFFYQTENFGQEVLTDEHIRGRLNAKIAIDAFWDEEATFLEKDLEVLADVTILDGELLDFKMLDDLSAVVKLDDLRHIKFSKLRNWLQIENGTLHLPAMFIQNNAMNLTIAGAHSFDHDMEYGIKVNAGQTVWNKIKSSSKDKNPIKAKNGWFNLYYRIHGNIDDFDYEQNKKKVKRFFDQTETRKRIIQEDLVRKFGAIDLLEIPEESYDATEAAPSLDETEEMGKIE